MQTQEKLWSNGSGSVVERSEHKRSIVQQKDGGCVACRNGLEGGFFSTVSPGVAWDWLQIAAFLRQLQEKLPRLLADVFVLAGNKFGRRAHVIPMAEKSRRSL